MSITKVFSSGGGVQSTAALVLSAQGKIDYPIHVFANVGNRAESRQTIGYVANVLVPYAKRTATTIMEGHPTPEQAIERLRPIWDIDYTRVD